MTFVYIKPFITLNYEERSKTLKRLFLFHRGPRNKSMSLQENPQRKYSKEQKMTIWQGKLIRPVGSIANEEY